MTENKLGIERYIEVAHDQIKVLLGDVTGLRGDINKLDNRLGQLEIRIVNLDKLMDKMDRTYLDERYIDKATFIPVQKLVYGAVGMILLAVLGGLVALVLR